MAASLELRLTGGASNSDPDLSLGGVSSTTVVSGTALNNIFDNVQYSETQSGDIEYRAISIHNAGDETASAVTIWLENSTYGSPDSEVYCGLDSTTQSVGDEGTAPSAVSFTEPLVGSPLAISDIASGSAQRIWFRRTIVAAAGNKANDYVVINLEYA